MGVHSRTCLGNLAVGRECTQYSSPVTRISPPAVLRPALVSTIRVWLLARYCVGLACPRVHCKPPYALLLESNK